MSTTALPSSDLATPFARRGEPAWEVAFLFPAQGSWTEDDYDGRYRLHGEFGPSEAASSVLLSGLRIPVADVFAAGEAQ